MTVEFCSAIENTTINTTINTKTKASHWQSADAGQRRKGAIRHDACAKAIPAPVLPSCTFSKRVQKGAFVSHQRLCQLPSAILLICALLAGPALAQTGAAPNTASAAHGSDTLTPEQANRALDTLQDDTKRARMIDTLRAIAKAAPQGQPAPQAQAAQQAQAAPPAPEPHHAIPLTADILGAQLLLTVSEQVGDISHEIAYVARSLTHFPAFYYWIVRTANDPAAYDQLLDIAWKLALVFGCALAGEWLIFRLVKRPVALLEARIPQAASAPAQTLALADPPSSAADVTAAGERHRRHLSLARAWQSLVRLPFVLGRLALELLPVFVFVGVATMFLGAGIGHPPTTRPLILAVA